MYFCSFNEAQLLHCVISKRESVIHDAHKTEPLIPVFVLVPHRLFGWVSDAYLTL